MSLGKGMARWHSEAHIAAVSAAALAVLLAAGTLLALGGSRGGVELLRGRSHSALEAEIARLKTRLDAAKQHALGSRAGRGGVAAGGRGRRLRRVGLTATDPSEPLQTYTGVARDNAAWHRHHPDKDAAWSASDQAAYHKAVEHAQIAEKGTHEMFQPLRLQQGYLHGAEKEEEAFETQLVDMVKLLEPSYLGEVLQWAQTGSTEENGVLKPVVGALEKPLIRDLDMEARARVERSVEAIAMKHKLTLPEKEQLRAHLMAPLMMRIRARVHAQVSHYVTKMARQVVLKAANTSTPAGQAWVAAMSGVNGKAGGGVMYPNIPSLTEEDLSFTNAMHDLDSVYKSGVINHYDYETQKAKLLTDWLKRSINKAGGNADEALRLVLGGDVRGVTDVGIENPQDKNRKKAKGKESKVDVRKKLELEKGIAKMTEDRSDKMTNDLVYELIHGKEQWGSVTGCTGRWDTRECKKKWEAIKADIEAAQNAAHDKDADEAAHWGENYDDADDELSPGTMELYTHLTHAHRTRIKQKLLSRQSILAAEH